MAVTGLPRVATYKINYSTGEAWTQGAGAEVYCSAKYKNMAQWQYDLTALQAERAGRQIVISRATVEWKTSAKYTYDIRVQNERCYGRNWGVYLGDAKGTSTTSMQWISTTRYAPHDSILLIQDTINSGATDIYVSCQNESTRASGYGACQYGTLYIEYEYATPLTVINYSMCNVDKAVQGDSVNITASIRNVNKDNAIDSIQLELVRAEGENDIRVGDIITINRSVQPGELTNIDQEIIIPHWDNPARSTDLYLKITIAGADSEKARLCSVLDKLYRPTIETFKVYRARMNLVDGAWSKNDNGVHTLTDLKLYIGEGATGFTLYAYYAENGQPDISSEENRINLNSKIDSALSGLENALNVIDTANGWGLNSDWHFTLIFTDGYETARMDEEVKKAFTNMHLAGLTTGGVRFGGYCTRSEQGNPAFECDYPIYADGGIPSLDYSTTETKLPYKWIDGKAIYRRVFVAENVTGANYSFADAIDGLETVVTVSGMFYNQYGQFPIPYVSDGEGWAYVLIQTSKQVLFQQSGGIGIDKVVVVVDYTKGG